MAKKEPARKRQTPLPAKLTVPKFSNVVSRTRLFKLLDTALLKPVTWLSAPAGAGKTTLIASYLSTRKIKPLWYQIDLRDTDPATFFSYLRQAVTRLSPRKHETLSLLSPEYALGLPVFIHNFFEQVFIRLPKGTLIVFDNFHDLADSSPLIDLLAQVASSLPEYAHILITSRSNAPASFARLRATRQLADIAPDSLLLTKEEARQIGKFYTSKTQPLDNLDELNTRAGGWAAGLILLLERGDIATTHQDKKVSEHLFDFFAAEIMQCEPTSVQNFLMQSALLPIMDPTSTIALTGNNQAEAILRDLVRRNYFITQRTGSTSRYEYHPLFRSYLLDALPKHNNPEIMSDLKKRAGNILIEQGEFTAAVELLSSAGAVDDLVVFVLGQAERLIAEGQFQTLQWWLEAIPETSREQQPWLLYWQGISLMPADIIAARQYFEQAYNSFEHTHDITGMCMSWAGVVDTILNVLDSFYQLDPWIDAMDRIVNNYGQPTQDLSIRVAPRMYGALIMRRPEHPQLKQWKSSALDAFDADQNLSSKLLGGFYLSATAIWSDDFAAAHEMLILLRKVGRANMAIPAARIVRELFESWINWLSGKPEQALQAAEAGLSIGQQTGARLWESLMLIEALVSTITAGDLARAEEYIELLRPMLPYFRRWDRAYFYHENGWYMALKGNFAEAMRLQSYALQEIEKLGGILPEAEVRIGMSQAYSLNDKHTERDHELEIARCIGERTNSPLIKFSVAFAGTGYALDDGDLDRARELATKSLGIGNHQGYRNFTWWIPQQAARICAFSLENGIEPEYVQELIQVRALLPPSDRHQSESWPWHVRIYTLNRFAVVIDNKPVTFSGRSKTKVIEMLKAIIALGGRNVSEQHLSDLLWPDADGDMARASFKVTLHRLRKLLGTEALKMHAGRLNLVEQYVWLDIWMLERMLNELEKSSDDDISCLANEIIDRYRGGFLQDESHSWALSTRERIRGRFLRVIGQAAEQLSAQNQWDAAIACYQKALETEPLAERFYLGLMRCYYHLGQPAEGILTYNRCREALDRDLDLTPSPQIEEWYNKLTNMKH